MFGRELIEQVHADARGSGRAVPILVEKCIMAVEERGESHICKESKSLRGFRPGIRRYLSKEWRGGSVKGDHTSVRARGLRII